MADAFQLRNTFLKFLSLKTTEAVKTDFRFPVLLEVIMSDKLFHK